MRRDGTTEERRTRDERITIYTLFEHHSNIDVMYVKGEEPTRTEMGGEGQHTLRRNTLEVRREHGETRGLCCYGDAAGGRGVVEGDGGRPHHGKKPQ